MTRPSSVSRLPYLQDAVRIQAQNPRGAEGQAQFRRFSVDPALTDFSILRNLIGRAFDMKGDFTISYRAFDDNGSVTFLPMVSDWDLSAAFLSLLHLPESATDPDLQLMIEPKIVPMSGEGSSDYDEPWELIRSAEVMQANQLPIANHHRRTTQPEYQNQKLNKGSSNVNNLSSPALNPKINTDGIFNTMERWVQKALTFVEDISVVTARPPLSDVEFRNYLDPAGILCRPKELRFACYHGGIEPSLRKVVWKHLLNVYPDGLTGNGRLEYVRNKAKEYYELRDGWKTAIQNGFVSEEVLCLSNMVRKDVLRTDRHLKFFAGHDDNPNIASLFNLIFTYAVNHPSVGYCQGMSDLAAPLLVTMGDEAQAFICFCALMERMNPNFNCDGLAMSLKFAHLSETLAFYDSLYWSYLKSIGADDLLFCYRWLLLEMKREFAFEDALRMMEVLWASLPYKPRDVPLFEEKYTGTTAHTVPIPVPSLTSSYSKVCAIRRTSVSMATTNDLRQRRLTRKQKASPHHSLDENSLTSLSSSMNSSSLPTNRKHFHSLDDTMEILSTRDIIISSSPFEILSLSNFNSPKPKLVKNLKEFWHIGRSNSMQCGEMSPDSKSSTPSTLHNSTCDTNGEKVDSSVFMADEGKGNKSKSQTENCIFRNHTSSSTSSSGHGEVFQSIKTNPSENYIVEHEEKLKNGKENTNLCEKYHGEKRDYETVDSGSDSGHCCSDSLEMDNSIDVDAEEPEFQSAGMGRETNGQLTSSKLPPPEEFGGGNPFLMFLCLTLLLQHRDHVMRNRMDYNETAMYFDKMVRKHNVSRVLSQARHLYSTYLKQIVEPRPQGADLQEELEEVDNRVDETSKLLKSLTLESALADLVPEEEILLKSCLEEIQNVMGDSSPVEAIIISQILRVNFNVEKALDACLKGITDSKPRTVNRKLFNTNHDDQGGPGDTSKIKNSITSKDDRKSFCGTNMKDQSDTGNLGISKCDRFDSFAKAHFDKISPVVNANVSPLSRKSKSSVELGQSISKRRIVAVESILAMQSVVSDTCQQINREGTIHNEAKLNQKLLFSQKNNDIDTQLETSNTAVRANSCTIIPANTKNVTSSHTTTTPKGINLLFANQRPLTIKHASDGLQNLSEQGQNSKNVLLTSNFLSRGQEDNSYSEKTSNEKIDFQPSQNFKAQPLVKPNSNNSPNLLFAAQKRLVIKPTVLEVERSSSSQEKHSLDNPVLQKTHSNESNGSLSQANIVSIDTTKNKSLIKPSKEEVNKNTQTTTKGNQFMNNTKRLHLFQIPKTKSNLDKNLIKSPSEIGKRMEHSSLNKNQIKITYNNISHPTIELWSLFKLKFQQRLFKFDILSPDAMVAIQLEKSQRIGNSTE